jgi:catalase
MDVKRAEDLSASDPDYSIRDLFNSIAKGDHPAWNLHIQVMSYEEAERAKFNPFDVTKVWSQKQYPLIPVGRMVLDRNPNNYFAEVEQIAFCPSHLVPGIEPSPDKMLQGRLFSYTDTHRHRLGANYLQLPVNCPYRVSVKNYQRDGPACFNDNQGGAPNYYPNSFSGPETCPRTVKLQAPYKISGEVYRYDSGDEDNFSQATIFWNQVLDDAARKRLVSNIAGHVVNAKEFIQERAIKNFSQVSADFGQQLRDAIKLKRSAKM